MAYRYVDMVCFFPVPYFHSEKKMSFLAETSVENVFETETGNVVIGSEVSYRKIVLQKALHPLV